MFLVLIVLAVRSCDPLLLGQIPGGRTRFEASGWKTGPYIGKRIKLIWEVKMIYETIYGGDFEST